MGGQPLFPPGLDFGGNLNPVNNGFALDGGRRKSANSYVPPAEFKLRRI